MTRGTDDAGSAVGSYVYAICSAETALPIGAQGLAGHLRSVRHGDLMAVVGDAPEGPLRPSRRHLVAHQEVVAALHSRERPALPMRFGVVFPDDRRVRSELLESRGGRLCEWLERLAGQFELHVKLIYDPDVVLERALASDPRIEELRRRSEGIEARVHLGERVVRVIDRLCTADGNQVLAALGPHATDVEVHSLGSEAGPFRASFLVSDAMQGSFDSALDRVGHALGPGITVKCVGPLPPYTFVAELD